MMALLSKYSHHFGELQRKYYIDKIPSKKKIVKKCRKKLIILKFVLNQKKYYQKKIGLKILKKFGRQRKKLLQKNYKISLKID